MTKPVEPHSPEFLIGRAQKRLHAIAIELEEIAVVMRDARDADLADRKLMQDFALMCRAGLARIEARLGLRKGRGSERHIRRDFAA